MNDTIAANMSDEIKNAMTAAKLGYDPKEIAREAFDRIVDRSVCFKDFEEVWKTACNANAPAGKRLGNLTEKEFRALAEITMIRVNVWSHQKKAEKEMDRAQARNKVLWDEIMARLGFDESTPNLVMNSVDATVISAEDTDPYVQLLKQLGIQQ